MRMRVRAKAAALKKLERPAAARAAEGVRSVLKCASRLAERAGRLWVGPRSQRPGARREAPRGVERRRKRPAPRAVLLEARRAGESAKKGKTAMRVRRVRVSEEGWRGGGGRVPATSLLEAILFRTPNAKGEARS